MILRAAAACRGKAGSASTDLVDERFNRLGGASRQCLLGFGVHNHFFGDAGRSRGLLRGKVSPPPGRI